MADAADQEVEYEELKNMFKECDVELSEDVWNAQLANYYGNSPGDILTKISGDLTDAGQSGLGWLIDANKTPYPHYYFSQVVPQVTGVSLMFMGANSNYGVYLYDKQYKMNPKSMEGGEWKAKFQAWSGFCPQTWTAQVTKINEETLDETKTMEAQNDNMLFWSMFNYAKAKPDTLNALKKLKFSLAGNQYKVIKVDTTGDADCMVAAEGNGECLCACRTKEGILVVNWASNTYKGEGRRKWGSLKGKNSHFFSMVKDLFQEHELLTIDGDGYM